MIKQKTKAFLTKALVGVFAASLFVGAIPYVSWGTTANAATQMVDVQPYIEWNFDDATKFYANTGTSAKDTTKDYTLQKWGGDIAAPGYVSFTENAVLYPTENPFVGNQDLTDFTLTMDVNASVASYYGSLFSFDSFSKSGDNHEKITRMDIRQPGSTAGRWMGWGDSKVHTISNSWSSWQKTVYNDSSALQNNTTVTSGNVTVVFSVDSDSSIRVRVYKDGVKVSDDGDVSTVSLPAGWSLYNESSTYKKFTLGAAHDARYFNYETGNLTALARPMKGTMDNIRIYDFAMTEEQMAEYATTKKIETEVEIPEPTYKANIAPYIEWNFDDATKFYANTGTSAKDTTKDYTLQKWGGDIAAPGYVSFTENAVLYPTENPFVGNQDLTDFTLTMDVNASVASYYGSLFSFDSFSKSGDNHEKITRMDIRQPGSTAGRWMGWGDSKVHTISNSWSSWQKTVYNDSSALQNNTTVTSGNVTVVFSVDSDSSIRVRVYKDGVKVSDDGDVSTVSLPAGWSLYNESSTYKKFTLGAAHDARYFNYETGNLTALARPMKGTMDNIRIYDFAMTEEQMAEYAVNKKLETSGIQIAESANGEVTVDNHTPAVGSEVVFNVIPNAGYALKELKVNGEALAADENGVYKTQMVFDGLYVEATFEETMEAKIAKVTLARGASIRCGGIEEYSGLRFHMVATQADYEGLLAALPVGASVSFGMMIIPADYQEYAAFTLENFFGANAKYHLAERDENGNMIAYDGNLPQLMNFWTEQLYLNAETGEYEYLCSITKLKENNLTRAFVGVGLAKYTVGDEVTYLLLNGANGDFANNTRSMYQVAKLAVVDADTPAWAKTYIQKNYIDKVENAVTALTGKKVSILGDSISTFAGVSNNAEVNATIGDNEVFYNTQLTQADTWWQQAIDNNGMSLLVNNAWAGSNVATNYGNTEKGGCTDRAVNLHNVDNVTPDIIAVYMGINDCGCLTELGEFDEISDIWDGTQYVGDTEKFATAYAIMIHKIKTAYANADVFLFTLPRNGFLWQGTKEQYNALQDEYNKMIYKIAETFGCTVVDLATSVGENYEEYLLSDDIHPNAKGMDVITAAFETALYTHYLAANNQ